MNLTMRGYVIFYPDKYYKLMWSMEKEHSYGFERSDLELGLQIKQNRDLHFGFYRNFEELEIEVFLYQNKGVFGQYMINTKPQPQFILVSKGPDPDDFFQKFAFEISKIPKVQGVLPIDFSKSLKIKELLYSKDLC